VSVLPQRSMESRTRGCLLDGGLIRQEIRPGIGNDIHDVAHETLIDANRGDPSLLCSSGRVPSPGRFGAIQEPRHPHLERPGWLPLAPLPLGQRALVQFQPPRKHLLG
jgi:hypothetical protein